MPREPEKYDKSKIEGKQIIWIMGKISSSIKCVYPKIFEH
jgi:hypothetical protein